ncbi:DUF4177 domain-containing protein [Anaeromyxobacter oryzae]|uniref:DUF4177 domain-containing protein n=1 Tax=Anaeromyxobacter oryzae TaxID=2918170 RepID=A0ABM7WQF7_9BACT|nr:DUF4177 domain-containing protein [Anaeromyxobacter oryzae]BDG01701.1 hypothetical protein AMOR_06970 [Anaeromyxobacter oryzae]
MSSGGAPAPAYKVVEVSPVADETLERALNEWTGQGFAFESLHFVMREGSHRPALAYLFFVRGEPPGGTTARAASAGRA